MSHMDEEFDVNLDLLHPELLNAEQLTEILKQRNVRIDDFSVENLLDLFRRAILPLPQRDCRTNRRGQLLSENRPRQSLKRKASGTESKTDIKLQKMATVLHEDDRLDSPSVASPSNKKMITFNSGRVNGSSDEKTVPNMCSKSAIKIINETLKSSISSNGSETNSQTKRKNEDDPDSPKKKHKPITWP